MTHLSVIIPLSTEGWRKTPVLYSLLRQQSSPLDYEVVIVADPTEPLPQVLESIRSPVQVVRCDRNPRWRRYHSAGAKRNAGAAVAKGRRLVFIDSDCAMDAHCLSRHLMYADSSLAICGWMGELPYQRTEGAEAKPFQELILLAVGDDRELALRSAGRPTKCTFLHFYSGNASVDRRHFDAVGGFDVAGYRCHDIDLGAKLSREGIQFLFEPTARVLHFQHPRSLDQRLDQVIGLANTAKKIPELTPLLRHSVSALRASYANVTRECRGKFEMLCRELPIRRSFAGFACIEPDGIESVPRFLRERGVPFVDERVGSKVVFHLGLHRSCWDFRLIGNAVRHEPDAPLLTVIVPACNEESVLARCLESVFREACDDFEVVVVDDGSTDNTLEVASAFGCFGNLKVVSIGRNRGLALTLNAGLSVARGQFVLHLDADDELTSNALKIVRADLRELSDADVLVYGTEPVARTQDCGEGAYFRGPRELLFALRRMYPRVYRRSRLKEVGGWAANDAFRGRFAEDRWVLYRLAMAGSNVYEEALPIARVSERAGSLSRRDPQEAAAAKLGIFALEAGALGVNVDYHYRRRSLEGSFEMKAPAYRWTWSVVIPCHNCGERLGLALASWAAVRGEKAQDFELIVVDDGSSPEVMIPPGIGLSIRLLRNQVREGPAAARNRGARAATGEFLYFSDGDHLVPPNVLDEHERLHHVSEATLIVFGGLVRPKVETLDRRSGFLNSAFRPSIEGGKGHAAASVWRLAYDRSVVPRWETTWLRLFLRAGADLDGVWFSWLRAGGGGVSIARAAFEALGGFDSRLLRYEDWDFALRSLDLGWRLHFASGATPVHQSHARAPFVNFDQSTSLTRFEELHPDAIGRLRRERIWERIPAAQELLSETRSI